jgi:hypothetical protein
MFASRDQDWLSAKYHRTPKLTVCDRAVSYLIQSARRSNETGGRAQFFDLVFGECK